MLQILFQVRVDIAMHSDESSYEIQDAFHYNSSLDSNITQPNHFLLQHDTQHLLLQHQQTQHEALLDDGINRNMMSAFSDKNILHPLPSSKVKQSKPPLQGEEKKLFFLAKYLEQISDENVAMGYLTKFETCERIKKGSEDGDKIIAALIDQKVSQRILRNVLGIGFHRYSRILSGLPPKKKGKKTEEEVDIPLLPPGKRARLSDMDSGM